MKTIKLLAHSRKTSSTFLLACLGLVTLIGCSGNAADGSAEVVSPAKSSTELTKTAKETAVSQNNQIDASASSQSADANATNTSFSAQAPVEVAETVAMVGAIDIATGMTYAEARSQLMQQGWLPIEGPEPGPYGAERTLYNAGFTEVSACSGSGAGACSFSFYHPERSAADGDNGLDITTSGGSSPEIAEWSTFAFTDTPSNSANSGAQQLSQIPAQFHGEWSADLALCGKPFNDSQLVIDSDRLVFYESFGSVTDIVADGDSEMTVTAELSSEGTSFVNTYTFQLSDDQSALTESKYGSVRYRCPED